MTSLECAGSDRISGRDGSLPHWMQILCIRAPAIRLLVSGLLAPGARPRERAPAHIRQQRCRGCAFFAFLPAPVPALDGLRCNPAGEPLWCSLQSSFREAPHVV